MVERTLCMREARGSMPLSSKIFLFFQWYLPRALLAFKDLVILYDFFLLSTFLQYRRKKKVCNILQKSFITAEE